MNGISDSVTMSYMKIGERSFEIFYISTADALGLCWWIVTVSSVLRGSSMFVIHNHHKQFSKPIHEVYLLYDLELFRSMI